MHKHHPSRIVDPALGASVTSMAHIGTTDEDAKTEMVIQTKHLTAPRLTPEWIKSVIAGEKFVIMPDGRTTICELTLANGFTVRGESSCVSIENFDAEIGQKVSREAAVDKIWLLEGYLLAQRLYERKTGTSTVTDKVDDIARVCHEVNRAYSQSLGDDSHAPWELAPDWQKKSARTGVELHLNNPDAGAAASHESWLREKVAAGWTYGPVKNPEDLTHPCVMPFEQLPPEQQAKDWIFRAVVHALA